MLRDGLIRINGRDAMGDAIFTDQRRVASQEVLMSD